MAKHSLLSQASMLKQALDAGLIDAWRRKTHMRESEADRCGEILSAAAETLGLFAAYETEIRAAITAARARGER